MVVFVKYFMLGAVDSKQGAVMQPTGNFDVVVRVDYPVIHWAN
jgi:hypothetical protein